MRPDAIVLAPSDYVKTLPYARKVEETGIKLVILDSVMAEEAGCCVVATDNLKAGYRMGEYMKPYLNEDSVIGIMEHIKGVSTAVEREQGLLEALGTYGDQIVDVRYCDSSNDKSYEETKAMLTEDPDINVIFCLNEDSASGAARAVHDMGLGGKVAMVGFDSSLEEIQFLESGVFNAIVVQRPLNMGYLGLSMAYQAARSQEVPRTVESGGVFAFGATAVGIYSAGVAALGKEIAVGVSAMGETAIGETAKGTHCLLYERGVTTGLQVEHFLEDTNPYLWKPLRDMLAAFAMHI